MFEYIWLFLGNNASNFIAISALALTVWQAAIQRKHNRLSTRPHITDSVVSDVDVENKVASIELFLENNGLGPAFINSFDVTLNDRSITFEGALKSILANEKCTYTHTSLSSGSSIKQGDKFQLLKIEIPSGNQEDLDRINNKSIKSNIEIKYSSIYGESFSYTTSDKPRDIL